MTKFWPAVFIFLLWSAFALITHEYASNSIFGSCAIAHNHSTNHIENQQIEENSVTLKTDQIKKEDVTPSFNFPKGLIINSLNGNVNILEESIGFEDAIYNYLNANQEKELLISAKYLISEVDSAKGIHYGNTRLEALNDLFVKAGINPDKIISKTELSEFNYDENGAYGDGISLQFQNISSERIAEVEEGISNKTLYSNFAAKEFKPDRKLKSYTIELKNYLKKYPNKKIYIVGHTDSIGEDNYRFGLDRAFNVKEYLTSQDVAPSIIIATSKGEDEPVAANASEEGRAKNRRIEITIK